jgi:phage shock protein C
MSNGSKRNEWTVLAGIVLVAFGAWLLLQPVIGVVAAPFAAVLGLLARIGWPLVLIGIGILLIIRARGGGFNVAGKKLYRSRSDKMLGGVLGGLAVFLNVDATILRVGFVLLTLVTGAWLGVLLYIAAMIIVPEEEQPAAQGGAPWASQPAANAPAPPPPAPPIPAPPASAPTPPPVTAPEPPSDSDEPSEAPPAPQPPTAP